MVKGEFYFDMQRPEVERLAKAIVRDSGHSPEEMVFETGRLDAVEVPRWWKEQSFARSFLACQKAMGDAK